MTDDRDPVNEAIDIMRDALTKIASFTDSSAERHLIETGSFAHFDEPSSVAMARDALGRIRTMPV